MSKNNIDYKFNNILNCLLEIDAYFVKKLIPQNLYPIEIQPNLSLISIIGFDFKDTPCGSYQEVIIGVAIQPYLLKNGDIPKSAIFPINIITNTDNSKMHAISNYKLPHYMNNIIIDFEIYDTRKTLTCKENNEIFLTVDLSIGNKFLHSYEYHQSLVIERKKIFLSEIKIKSMLAENQNGMGKVVLKKHPFYRNLEINEINNIPYLERYACNGVETMSPLISI